MLVDVFSTIDNILLIGQERPCSLHNRKKTEKRLAELQAKYHIDVNIHNPVERLVFRDAAEGGDFKAAVHWGQGADF